jgi:hypothetical protein
MLLTSKMLWLRPGQFSSGKFQGYRPRTGFYTGTTVQSILPPLSGNFKWRQRRKDDLLPTVLIRLFLCLTVKLELAGISLSQGSFKLSWDGVIQNITKYESADAFQQWMDCCENSCLTRQNNIPKQLNFQK